LGLDLDPAAAATTGVRRTILHRTELSIGFRAAASARTLVAKIAL